MIAPSASSMEQFSRRGAVSTKAPVVRSDSTSTVDSESFSFNAMKQQLFKTKMCRHFINGRCKYADKCTFSHDQSELTVRTDFAKTKLCKKNACTDPACGYAHSIDELRVPTSSLCSSLVRKGKCDDASCKLSHNTTYFSELQVAKHAGNVSIASPVSTTADDVTTPTVDTADLVNTLIRMLSMAQQEG
jgi:hypothetical protein